MARLDVKVVPGVRRTELVSRYDEGIKVRLAAPAEGGRANRALMDLIADLLGVKSSSVRIVRGLASQKKVVEIDGLEPNEMWARLDQHIRGASPR
jgi:uncharacterized protein (TIGR00251 family)